MILHAISHFSVDQLDANHFLDTSLVWGTTNRSWLYRWSLNIISYHQSSRIAEPSIITNQHQSASIATRNHHQPFITTTIHGHLVAGFSRGRRGGGRPTWPVVNGRFVAPAPVDFSWVPNMGGVIWIHENMVDDGYDPLTMVQLVVN